MTKLSFYLRRRWLELILGAVLALLVASFFGGPLGPRDLAILRAHRAALEASRDHLLADNTQLKARIAHLRSDDTYLQRLIRSELGYARADELVYRFGSGQTSPHP